MTKQIWKLGDPCFIVMTSLSEMHQQFDIHPATVTHVGGLDGTTVVATAFAPAGLSPHVQMQGKPYSSKRAAHKAIKQIANGVQTAAQAVTVTGIALNRQPEGDVPENGQRIYVIDVKNHEILESKVCAVALEVFRNWALVVTYDTCPGGLEGDAVPAQHWTYTREQAEKLVRKSPVLYTFVSEAQLRERTERAADHVMEQALDLRKRLVNKPT